MLGNAATGEELRRLVGEVVAVVTEQVVLLPFEPTQKIEVFVV